MDIIEIKSKLAELEKHGTSMDVYEFLRNVWNERKDAAVTLLVVDEMLDILMWISEASAMKYVPAKEEGLYRDFFEEAADFGYENCLNDKLFLWRMAYICRGYATYYFIINTSFCKNCTGDEEYERLIQTADRLFPGSLMFKLIPDIMDYYITWIDKISDSECRRLYEELQELHLQNNASDDSVKDNFMLDRLEKRLGIQ